MQGRDEAGGYPWLRLIIFCKSLTKAEETNAMAVRRCYWGGEAGSLGKAAMTSCQNALLRHEWARQRD